jgi:hypothetical protein
LLPCGIVHDLPIRNARKLPQEREGIARAPDLQANFLHRFLGAKMKAQ